MRGTHQTLMDAIRREASDVQLTIDEIPPLSVAFPKLGRESESDPFVPYPSPASRPNLDSPAVYLHSSGSTGFTKPISFSHRIQIKWMSQSKSVGVMYPFNLDPDQFARRTHARLPRYAPFSPFGCHVTSFFSRIRPYDAALCPVCVCGACCPISSSRHHGCECPPGHAHNRQHS